jgi:transposase
MVKLRKVLPRTEAARNQRARGNGGHGLLTLVERLLTELGFEVWIGDAAEIKTKRVRKKKKNDREDARLMLKIMLENRFPRIWVPSRSATAALAPASAGADADANHESAASCGDERRIAGRKSCSADWDRGC